MTDAITTLVAAVTARDSAALAGISDLSAARLFASTRLPQMGAQACRWFWSQAMAPAQLEATSHSVQSAAARQLVQGGFVPGTDFSAVLEQDLDCLLLSRDALSFLLSEMPVARHSSLLAFCSSTEA